MRRLRAGFLSRLLRRPLRIRHGERTETFRQPAAFAAFLAQRTDLPSGTREWIAALDHEALERALHKTLKAHKNAVNLMVQAVETGESVAGMWRWLDISRAPDEHDWPVILFAVGNTRYLSEGFFHEALVNYIQYLEARRDAIEQRLETLSGGAAPVAEGIPQAEERTRERIGDCVRLPPGQPVRLRARPTDSIAVYFGSTRFHLQVDEAGWRLSGPQGQSYPLPPGRHAIGRSSACQVVLDRSLTDISRRHLVVEVGVDGEFMLTDVSSRGSYLPEETFVPLAGQTSDPL